MFSLILFWAFLSREWLRIPHGSIGSRPDVSLEFVCFEDLEKRTSSIGQSIEKIIRSLLNGNY